MKPIPKDLATVVALRSDLALQIARSITRTGESRDAAARRFNVPQYTLRKIIDGRVGELSLELLIRIAVRAGLPLVLQTGREPSEAGVFVTGVTWGGRLPQSRVAEGTQKELIDSARRLTPEQRLNAHLGHSELVAALRQAGREIQVATRSRQRRGAMKCAPSTG